jgi:pilus assembly protein CpaE
VSGRRPAAGGEAGQASVELLGGLPALLITALIVFQLLAAGYSKVLAGNAAEAAALAAAAGGEPRSAARAAVPGWSRARMTVESHGGRVTIRMRPPSPLRAVGRALEVEASAAVNP